MPTPPPFDRQEFRRTLGCFTTGVTVITTRSADDQPIGVTANSFNSVSLDPPLVLWSLAKSSLSLNAFDTATHWAVHILSASQEDLSNRFARAGEDKFKGIDVESGVSNVPLLRHCTARLQCKTTFKYEGGDHIIFVGEVVDFERSDSAPLVFHAGRYAVATQRQPALSLAAVQQDALPSDFNEDFLDYLLGRARLDFELCLKRRNDQHQVSDIERCALLALASREPRSMAELAALLTPAGRITAEVVAALVERGWAQPVHDTQVPRWHLTTPGRDLALNLIASTKAVESEILDRFGQWNALSLKTLLKLLIVQMDSGVPHPWDPAAVPAPNASV